MINVILLEKISKLGNIGEIVKVKDGFARNYLLPNKKAIRASTPGVLQEPFQIDNSWLILRLEEKRLAKLDARMKGRMAFELFQLYLEEETNKVLQNTN